MAASGEIYWPPTGRSIWPLTWVLTRTESVRSVDGGEAEGASARELAGAIREADGAGVLVAPTLEFDWANTSEVVVTPPKPATIAASRKQPRFCMLRVPQRSIPDHAGHSGR